jgi:hypothetical protein
MGYVHICRPRGYYIGQVRQFGYRRWSTVTGRCRKPEPALSRAVAKMRADHKRARALFVDTSGYYGPHVSMEASR